MKLFNTTVIVYLSLMHLLTYFYCLNVVRVGFILTYSITSLSSLILILISFIIFIRNYSNLFKKSYFPYIFTIAFIILPITITYYFPLIFYKQIINITQYFLPSITVEFIYISYYPTFYLATLPQFLSSVFSALSVYILLSFRRFKLQK
jgi:hypothetical protein